MVAHGAMVWRTLEGDHAATGRRSAEIGCGAVSLENPLRSAKRRSKNRSAEIACGAVHLSPLLRCSTSVEIKILIM